MLYTEERLKVRGCLVLMVEDTSCFGRAVLM